MMQYVASHFLNNHLERPIPVNGRDVSLCKKGQEWFREHLTSFSHWYIPDLNPNENLWDVFEKALCSDRTLLLSIQNKKN